MLIVEEDLLWGYFKLFIYGLMFQVIRKKHFVAKILLTISEIILMRVIMIITPKKFNHKLPLFCSRKNQKQE